MSGRWSRRKFLSQSSAAGALATLPTFALAGRSPERTGGAEASESSRRPNILFIMTDQLRWDCLGANGNRIIQTPNLDRLISRSANFTTAVVQAPVCVPSRASFWTGRYPHSHRNRVNYTELKSDEVLMQALLRRAGYSTCIVGKSHVYHRYPATSAQAQLDGFDYAELHDGHDFTDQWSAYAKWRKENDPQHEIHYRRTAESLAKGKIEAGDNPFRAIIAEEFTDTSWTGLRTRHYIEQLGEQEQPWFLFSSFWKPHSPFEVPVPFDSMYNDVEIPLPQVESLASIERLPLPLQKLILRGKKPVFDMDRTRLQWCYRSYYAAISHIDREVGRIMDTLEKTGQLENTIVVFTSDHGDQLLEHGLMGKNCFFESSIRVPFVVSWPGRIAASRYAEMVEAVDLLPTLFELIGIPEPENCQGRSFAALVTGHPEAYEKRDAVFSENIIPEVITGGSIDFYFEKGKGVKGIRHPDAKMIRTERYKYCYYPDYGAELYDLLNDPEEQKNLAGDPQYASTAAKLKGRIFDWLISADEVDQIAPRWLIEKRS